jgi:hypothetical protein
MASRPDEARTRRPPKQERSLKRATAGAHNALRLQMQPVWLNVLRRPQERSGCELMWKEEGGESGASGD